MCSQDDALAVGVQGEKGRGGGFSRDGGSFLFFQSFVSPAVQGMGTLMDK